MISLNEPASAARSCFIEPRKNGTGWRPTQSKGRFELEEADGAATIDENEDGQLVAIRSSTDIATARQLGRALAIELGFEGGDTTLIVTVISEVARNIVDYATEGEIMIKAIEQDGKAGILIVARDAGPGIANVGRAVEYGCLTRKGLGMGLPGIRWLADEFEIVSQ